MQFSIIVNNAVVQSVDKKKDAPIIFHLKQPNSHFIIINNMLTLPFKKL